MSRHTRNDSRSISHLHGAPSSHSTVETGWGSWLRSVSSSFPSAQSIFGGSDSSIPSSPKSSLTRKAQFSPSLHPNAEARQHDDYPSDFGDDEGEENDPYSRPSRHFDRHAFTTPELSPWTNSRNSSLEQFPNLTQSPHVHYEDAELSQSTSPTHPPPGRAVRNSVLSATTATTDTIMRTECQYHIRSLVNPSFWVGSLTLTSSAGHGIEDVSAEEMDETVTEMMKDWNSARWREVRLVGLSQAVWRGDKMVKYARPEGGDPIEGQMVMYAPKQVIRAGITGGVRIILCHK